MNIENLNSRIKACSKCEGLNQEATPDREATLNAPGYGELKSQVLILGQSLCGDPCINSQIPFTDGCGTLLDEAFDQCGVRKKQLYITNVVKCHPVGNKKSLLVWKENCSNYLQEELTYASPSAIICLGRDAADIFYKKAIFGTYKELMLNNKKTIVHFLYHPQYIKQWKPSEEKYYIKSISAIIKSYIA